MSSHDSDRESSRFSAKQYIPWGGGDSRGGPAWQGPRVGAYLGETDDEIVLSTKNDEPCEWIASKDSVVLEDVR